MQPFAIYLKSSSIFFRFSTLPSYLTNTKFSVANVFFAIEPLSSPITLGWTQDYRNIPKGSKHENMSKFRWLVTNALLRHGNVAKNQKFFYSTCSSPELHPILPNLINSAPGSSVNFHLVDIFTKSELVEGNWLGNAANSTNSD